MLGTHLYTVIRIHYKESKVSKILNAISMPSAEQQRIGQIGCGCSIGVVLGKWPVGSPNG